MSESIIDRSEFRAWLAALANHPDGSKPCGRADQATECPLATFLRSKITAYRIAVTRRHLTITRVGVDGRTQVAVHDLPEWAIKFALRVDFESIEPDAIGAPVAARDALAWLNDIPDPERNKGHVFKVLDVSTAHLTPGDLAAWEQSDTPTTEWRHPDGYGAFFPVPALDDEPDGTTKAWSAIFAKARELGCTYVLIDRDADDVPGLESYDHG